MRRLFIFGFCLFGFFAPAWANIQNETNSAPKLSFPAIRSLKLEPASLTLKDGRDERRVLVLGETAAGEKFDLSSQAKFSTDSTIVEIDGKNFIKPKTDGATKITISAAGATAQLPVQVESAKIPEGRFVRDIEPLIAKIGCNAGTCHGSAKGKNGFKLSLRGYDPDFDYQALINDLSGRRFNRVKVEDSLMLLKPTAEVSHEGRQVLKPDSREYNLLKQWIVEGTKFEDPKKSRAEKIELLPAEVQLDLPGRAQQILVIAHYPDGTIRDVTREAIFSSNNGDVASVTNGLVTATRRGEAAVLVRYEGSYATKLVTVMGDRTGFKFVEIPEYNFIDKGVNAKLTTMKILPSELCTDAEFLRRVSLDLTGLPPTPEKVREFLADKNAPKSKREKLINELLESPEYAEYWANKWADLLQCNSEILGEKGVWVFRNWIQQAITQNMPYDKFVRTLLLAQGSSYQNPEVNYLRALRDTGKMTEDISQTFLGVRFNCNKCHDHPFEKWTQNQYYQFGAYFARVGTKNGALPGEQIIFAKYDGGEVKHPKTDMDVAPKVPVGAAKEPPKEGDRRDVFVEWLASKENPFFAKSMANRTWSYFFGRGIIDPVDDIRGSNPASNPELLDALTDEFIKSNFDVKKLMRTICLSRTYQLSIVKNKWNEDDTINFSHATPRRLSAEQLLDAVAVATGSKSKFSGMPRGTRAVEIPDGMVAGNDFLTLFGRPKRQSACECERSSNVTLSHALNLINGPMIGEAVTDKNNRVATLVEKEKDDKKVVEEIYLSVLNRP
ncbi:MAG: DUF1549 domain-containing protein, partial [Limisphaerales bacterium]